MKSTILKISYSLLLCIVLSNFAFSNPNDDIKYSEMLAEVMKCFSVKQHPEQLINEWRWGYIKSVFTFSFADAKSDKNIKLIFAACPLTASTNFSSFFPEFPNVYDFVEEDNPYFFFGVEKNIQDKNRKLKYVYCPKSSPMYRAFLKFYNTMEPTVEKLRLNQPLQYWDTITHNANIKKTHANDQFILWGNFATQLEIIFRFNQGQCRGLMVKARDNICLVTEKNQLKKAVNVFDLQRLSKSFKWIPCHQVERFNRETEERFTSNKIEGETNENHAYYNLRRLNIFTRERQKYMDNEDYIKRLNFQFMGSIKTPSCEIVDAPWVKFNYYSVMGNSIVLRGLSEPFGYFDQERVDSFVIDLHKISKNEDFILPYNLKFKEYLQAYPTSNLLYEHIRADGRARIIVQPYIASLYVDGKLNKILVCNDKNGPADHGWSLVRKYYCYEEMPEYFWPVSRAYCPLELD